jgi:23S rRNA (uridine2552-2'-O)-methyltransferase
MVGGRRRTADHFSLRAKRESYPARSIYKLQEIDKRVRLFKKGDNVLDLGAAPGSWTLYASKAVGMAGKVVAVDRADLTIGTPTNVTYIKADALAIEPAELIALIDTDGFQSVISVMAPRTSGQKFVDQTRSYNLFCRALDLSVALCRHGGNFVGKIFQGEDFEKARDLVKEAYVKTRIIRPTSVRSESYETYIIGLSRL